MILFKTEFNTHSELNKFYLLLLLIELYIFYYSFYNRKKPERRKSFLFNVVLRILTYKFT